MVPLTCKMKEMVPDILSKINNFNSLESKESGFTTVF